MNSPYFTATLAQQRRAELETQARRHRMVHGGGRPDVTHADPAPGVVRRRYSRGNGLRGFLVGGFVARFGLDFEALHFGESLDEPFFLRGQAFDRFAVIDEAVDELRRRQDVISLTVD